jgi:hypothetical protein
METHDIPILREHAVQHERVQVDIEIQRTAEALHDRHRAIAAIRDALSPGAASQEPEHHPQRDADDSATQRVIPGEQVAQPMRQAQDPLSDRHIRQHVIDQMRRSLGHAAAAAPGQKPRPLHEKATRRSCPHAAHRKRAKPAARHPHRRKSRNSCSTNAEARRRPAATRPVHERSRSGPARCRTGCLMSDRAARYSIGWSRQPAPTALTTAPTPSQPNPRSGRPTMCTVDILTL